MSKRHHDSSFSGRNINIDALDFYEFETELIPEFETFSKEAREKLIRRAKEIAANEAYDDRNGHLNPNWMDKYRIDLNDRHFKRAENDILASKGSIPTAGPSVFISYANEDADWANGLATGLSSHGVSYFLAAETLRIGDNWLNQIADALRRCRICVFFATSNSKKSNWCKFEVGAAMVLQKKLLTVRITLQSEKLFEPLSRLQQFDLSGPDELDHLTKEVVKLAREAVS